MGHHTHASRDNEIKKNKKKKVDWCKNCIRQKQHVVVINKSHIRNKLFYLTDSFIVNITVSPWGFPLGPLMVDIFMIELETTLMPELKKFWSNLLAALR